jgi:histidinol-phosphate aminotransferase
MEHADMYSEQAKNIRNERGRLTRALSGLPEVEVFPSDANMVLVRVSDAGRTFERLKQRKILVKNVSGMHALLAGCLRLTVGTRAENDLLIHAMGELA